MKPVHTIHTTMSESMPCYDFILEQSHERDYEANQRVLCTHWVDTITTYCNVHLKVSTSGHRSNSRLLEAMDVIIACSKYEKHIIKTASDA